MRLTGKELFESLSEPVATVDLTDAWKVPADVLKGLPINEKSGKASTRGLGRSIIAHSKGERCVRTVDGVVYAVSTKGNPPCITDKMRAKYSL